MNIKSFQGIDPDLRKLEGSPDCDIVHGTYSSKLAKIFSSGGLSRMSRNHIHFSKGLPGPNTNVISGMRQDCDILFYVDFVKSTQGNSTYRNFLNYETGRIYMKYVFQNMVYLSHSRNDLTGFNLSLLQQDLSFSSRPTV